MVQPSIRVAPRPARAATPQAGRGPIRSHGNDGAASHTGAANDEKNTGFRDE
ncbi:hypothetical protein SDC9_68395 [bioreactor metagenome]|uniref:Uncharacterized protein n=1 Tax=bioreactor metagenome TaxID=1076179 RepID=A0A644Y0A8_9ZZZZ